MIRYALVCDRGHGFESWFRASDDYEAQQAAGLVGCPACGSTRIDKQVMAPQIARTDRTEPAAAQDAPVALIDERAQEMRSRIAELKNFLDRHSENVGPRFAEEARKIHYGDSDERTIHGQASREETEALVEEGIGFLPLPVLPEDRN